MKGSIVILETNVELLEELAKEGGSDGFAVVYAGDNGLEGIDHARLFKPSAAIVGVFLKGMDGCAVIREIRKESPQTAVVAVGIANDGLAERAINAGADYYLVKPFPAAAAFELIERLTREKAENLRGAGALKTQLKNEEKIGEILSSVRVPPFAKGVRYVEEGVKMAVIDPHIFSDSGKRLYFELARANRVEAHEVELAIAYVVESVWSKNALGAGLVLGWADSAKPTNMRFIALVADKFIFDNLL